MAKTSKIVASNRKAKYSTREKNRCALTGRPRGFMRDFKMCRNMFRELALKGQIPGVRKASW
ncbi:type Z 30S ribosomal protein S14 [bacterium]|nr:type Z 30S ribosomal protein S14 [bacterium]